MGLVAAFIGVAIIIAIGAQILGNSVSDCSTLPGYHTLNVNGNTNATESALTVSADWALQCEDINDSTQSAFALLVIVLIVIAAVIILSVVKML